jgi:hypothetical protein
MKLGFSFGNVRLTIPAVGVYKHWRFGMGRVIAAALACLISAGAASYAQDQPKLTLSEEPLTAEQIAIYRVVLLTYRKGSKDPLNLSDKTELLQRSEGSPDLKCISGVKLTPNQAPVIHRIKSSAGLGPKLNLVDLDRQQQLISQNDPQSLVKKAIDDHEQVSEKQLDESIRRAFETGVFAVSEIAFDKDHRFAVVAYSFVCGELCGNGSTLVLRKSGQNWKVVRRCGGWVS